VMLFGIVLRGTAFVFRSYDSQRDAIHHRWSLVFAISSVVTPFMLGVCLGAVSSGTIRLDEDGQVITDYFSSWLAPFPLAVGLFAVAVFSFLAAVYLTNEAETPEVKDDFRLRAFGATGAVTLLAWLCFFLAGEGAPRIRAGLWDGPFALPFQLVTGLIGLALLWALVKRHFAIAQVLAMTQVVMLIIGFCAAQYPYIVAPDISFWNAAAPRSVLNVILTGLAIGVVPLLLAYGYLLRVFKQPRAPMRSEEP
jgi:cytochrome d ubiquinol oxidase subunit II